MTIRTATPADLPHIRRLLQENRYNFLACGLEDVPDLLCKATTAVGLLPGDGMGVWGFVAFDAPAPAAVVQGSLPDGALRAAVIGRHLSPGASANQLIDQAVISLQAAGQPFQLTALTGESWLERLLAEQGFALTDHLCYYQRTRRSLPESSARASLRPLRQDESAGLIALDSLAFPPLWRMSETELIELCFTCRVQAAEVDGQLAGYVALALHPAPDRHDENQAQLSRLAVHPTFQGQGIGRQLLIDSIAYAHAQGCYRILLNTPESNPTAQRLYESLNFRRHGARMPVLVYTWPSD